MAKEILQTPLWILEQKTEAGLKIGMVIVELPDHKTLDFLDRNGHFQPAVLNQIVQLLVMLRGGTATGGLINTEAMGKFPEFPVDEDIVLLQFQKHYLPSTQTVCIPFTTNGEEQAANFSDNMVTNKYFKEADFILKYSLSTILEPNNITFTINGFGDKNFEAEEIAKVKSAIL